MGPLYHNLKEMLQQEKGVALATVVQGAEFTGGKLLIYPDQTTQGSFGCKELDAAVTQDAVQAIWSGDTLLRTYTIERYEKKQAFTVFIEGYPPPPSLIIIGAGHIAIALTTFAKTLNYHVTVIDARAAFATHKRFPHADDLIVAWPDEALASIDLQPSTAVAVLTHDPKFDEPALKVLLSHNIGYVGAIGSHKTSQERATRLKQEGLSDEQIARVHGPIGLDIGATSPEEIALAIMAQIVAVRHHKER